MLRESLRKTKSVMFVMLAVSVMLMSAILVKAESAPTVTIDKITYTIDEENLTATVESYTEKSNTAFTEVVIPSKILYNGKEYTVTALADEAFVCSSYVERIEIPNTVTEIGKCAFLLCTSLKEINLPVGLNRIKNSAFDRCSALEEIEIPSTVVGIESYAFADCVKLKKILIPRGVRYLETSCFDGCTALEEVVLPNSLITVSAAAFHNCDSLTRIVIPDSVTAIYISTLLDCDNMKTIFVPSHLKDVFLDEAYGDVAQASYVTNEDGTVSLTIEYLPEGVTSIEIPESIDGKEISTVTGAGGMEFKVKCTKHSEAAREVDETGHWYVCSVCKEVVKERHNYGTRVQACECGYIPYEITGQPTGFELPYASKNALLAVTVKKTLGKEIISCQWFENGKTVKGATGLSYNIPGAQKAGVYTYTCKLTCGGYSQVTKAAIVTVKPPEKGKKYRDDANMATYKVTKARTDGKGTVEYVKPVSKKKATIIIPATVDIGGVTYKVTSIAKNAFKNNRRIKRLTIEENVEKIGAKAFSGCKKLKNITIKTTKLKTKKVGANAFKNIKSNATVKVPKKKLKAYKSMLKKKGVGAKVKIKKM